MALTTLDAIKEMLAAEWDSLSESQYPEDLLSEMADSETPVYTHEIISEWSELPSEYMDSWQEYGMPDSATTQIHQLMLIDLYSYYMALYNTAYAELKRNIEPHQGHFGTFGGWFCDTCNSPYCELA